MTLFGYYRRKVGNLGYMRFRTHNQALKYGRGMLSSIDPYLAHMDQEITFVPGKLFRRTPKESA